MGPAALRTAGLVRPLEQLGYVVRDQGDLAIARDAGTLPSKEPRNLAEIAAWARVLSASVYGCLRDGAFPLVLGGDHSLSIGSIDGVARFCAETQRELFVLWLDAHADFNTLETSPSGNVHGMPLAALCGEPGFEALLGGGTRRVDPAHVSLFGIRSLDVGERALLEARSIDVVDMRTIDEFGVVVPLRRILDRVAAAKGLAQAVGIGVLGLSSLDILTRAAAQGGHTGLVMAAVDARRGEVFACVRELRAGRAPAEDVIGPGLFSPEELAVALSQLGGVRIVGVGDGAQRYAGVLGEVPGVSCVMDALDSPPPLTLLAMAAELYDAGGPPVAPHLVVPLYMRAADVTSNFAQVTSA